MDKLKMHSPDLSQGNIEKIRSLFPHCVTEANDENGKLKLAIDFDQLKQELSESIVEGPQERYQLNWPGKRQALLKANAPLTKTLRPCPEESVNFDTTENLFIEGDNLEALKLLQETYLERIKLIYIDPPYNTGKDFIYSDKFALKESEFLVKSEQKDDVGNHLVSNPESNGRFHSDWLTMMYPRIKLAHRLLSPEGILFVSIDDNEIENLKHICTEIFGDSNQISPFIWSLPRGINAGHISRAHEYIVGFAKSKSALPLFNKIGEAEYSIERCNKKVDRRHPASPITFPAGIKYEGDDRTLSGMIEGSESIEIEGEMKFVDGKLAAPVTLKAGWTMKNMIQDWLSGKKVFDTKGQEIVEFFFKANGKLYSKKKVSFESPKSLLTDVKDSQFARQEIEELLGDQDIFPYPKPTTIPERLIELATNDKDIIMDFFAGSGTTAHAVSKVNSKLNTNRKFITVQIPEKIDPKNVDNQAAINFCQDIGVPPLISEISKERLRRTINSQGFRVLKIDSSNMEDVFYRPEEVVQLEMYTQVENIKKDRTDEDLLFQVLLDWGVGLTLPISKQQIASKNVFFVNADEEGEGADLIACFSTNISNDLIKEIAEKQPLRVVFRDDGFANDSVKINVEQIFKQISPMTDVKSI